MLKLVKKVLCKRRIKKDGSLLDIVYILYVNNLEPITFPSQASALSYLDSFRNENQIFKLQIYRIETYSL